MNNIRLATLNDLNLIEQLENSCFLNDNYSTQMLIDNFNNKNIFTYLYFEDDVAVGYVSIIKVENEINILKICVEKEFRNKKIGSNLINFIISVSKDKSNYIYLEVRESNLVAIKFYQSLGFTKETIRKKYYGNDNALILSMRIDNEEYKKY